MTEQDWLTSNNPAEMGEFLLGRPGATYTGPGGLTPAKRISDRKMRLYCAAASSLSGLGPAKESWQKWGNAPKEDWEPDTANLSHWTTFNTVQGWNHWMSRDHPTEAARANVLRDLVGNPFQPYCVAEQKYRKTLKEYRVFNLEWLTPQVLDLASAAYSIEKIGCPRCDYTGKLQNENLPRGWQYCPHCESRPTGYLDNDRLLVLSDSLEESGCTDPAVLNHLRGLKPCVPCSAVPFPRCAYCNGSGWIDARPKCSNCRGDGEIYSSHRADCSKCAGEGYFSVKHYRGCWVLDLILGYE